MSDDIDYDILPDLMGYHLRRAQVAVFANFAQRVAEFEVRPGQFATLTLIDANPGLTQSALARAIGIERSTMVAVIDALEKVGLVERKPSPVDRRSYALELTAKGKHVLENLKRIAEEHEHDMLEGFTDDERATLIALLSRIGA